MGREQTKPCRPPSPAVDDVADVNDRWLDALGTPTAPRVDIQWPGAELNRRHRDFQSSRKYWNDAALTLHPSRSR